MPTFCLYYTVLLTMTHHFEAARYVDGGAGAGLELLWQHSLPQRHHYRCRSPDARCPGSRNIKVTKVPNETELVDLI